MKKILFFIFLPFLYTACFAQTDMHAVRDSIDMEGRRLYHSEMASWYGTDILVAQLKDRQQDIGGYFSYSYNDSAVCLFYDKGKVPLVLAAITFDSSYKTENAQVDALPRKFTPLEMNLYLIRTAALHEINSDTMFKAYKNTSLNLIPLINNGEKKVYVLTGPQNNGVVIFGNDYLLTFHDDNTLASKRRLHKSLISVEYGKEPADSATGISMHTHLPETGDLITATDICTLMLYEKFAKWKQHYVISKNYISIWDCSKNMLVTLTMEAWNRINKDQEERDKKP